MSEQEPVKDLVFHRADSHRQYQESENLKLRRLKEREAHLAGDALLTFLKSANCDAAEIVSKTVDLELNEKGFDGKVSFVVKAFHSGDHRRIEIPVLFKEGSYVLPESSVIENVLTTAAGLNATAALTVKAELIKQYAPVESEPMQKTASVTPPVGSSLALTMDVDKTWLPDDIKVGDLLFLDGAKYRVVSGDRHKLNADSDGSHWTLNLCHETAKPEEPVKSII